MATFQQQITASADDTYCTSNANYVTSAVARFGAYTAPKGGSIPLDAFVRFLLTIPKGSTINNAYLTLIAYDSRTDDFTAQIVFTDEDDAADFSTNPYGRADGGADVAWAVPDFVAGQPVQTPNIASLIQAFINRAGYNANNHIAIRIKHGDATGGEYQSFYQYDGGASYAAILTIEYTPPVVAVPRYIGDGLSGAVVFV
jgi:hypothetical protein